MNRRILISLAFAGSLAYACGPRAHSDASTALMTVFRQSHSFVSPIGAGSVAGRSAPDEKHDLTLSAQFDVTAQPSEVVFALEVKNDAGKTVEVNFPNGQTHDFIVVDSIGREVWRWADGRLFTQTMRNRLLGRGKSIHISERWTAPQPGHYTAIAVLRSSNYPVEQRVDFVTR